jgi:hypothetical protein
MCCRLVDLALNTVFFFRMLSASERDNEDEMRTLGREVRRVVGGEYEWARYTLSVE